MRQRFLNQKKREWIWTHVLLQRSAVLNYENPNRRNTLYAVLLIVISTPLAFTVFPILLIRVLVGRKVELYECRIRGEFAWLVEHFERIRGSRSGNTSGIVVVVRSTFRHIGLAHLYRLRLRCLVFWTTGVSSLFSQTLLLQPKLVISRTVLDSRNYFSFEMAVEPLSPSRQLVILREKTLVQLGCSQSRYVTMAVFTSTRAERADREYMSRTFYRETIGSEFAEPVDFLKANGVDVIMLGFPDHGKAHVPREMPRLSEFGEVGGLHEVALASGCLYFWSDYVGAQWLRKPFNRWLLLSNVDHSIAGYKHYNLPQQVLDLWISTLVRFATSGGHILTLREMLSMEPGYGAVARGELTMVRNSPEDHIDAHREMLSRVDGSWIVDDQVGTLQDRLNSIYRDFPDRHQLPISPSFLARHPYLLD